MQLDSLKAIGEYLDKYNKGEVTTPPTEKTLQTFQHLYIKEARRQEGLKVQNDRLRKKEEPVIEPETDVSGYSTLLDDVVSKLIPARIR